MTNVTELKYARELYLVLLPSESPVHGAKIIGKIGAEWDRLLWPTLLDSRQQKNSMFTPHDYLAECL